LPVQRSPVEQSLISLITSGLVSVEDRQRLVSVEDRQRLVSVEDRQRLVSVEDRQGLVCFNDSLIALSFVSTTIWHD